MRVHSHKLGIHGVDDLILLPGLNVVPDAKWGKIRKHPVIAAMIEEGTFEEMDEMSDDAPDEAAEGDESGDLEALKAMNVANASALIKETSNLELLKKWREIETRAKVIKPLDAQIKLLEAPPEYRETGAAKENLDDEDGGEE